MIVSYSHNALLFLIFHYSLFKPITRSFLTFQQLLNEKFHVVKNIRYLFLSLSLPCHLGTFPLESVPLPWSGLMAPKAYQVAVILGLPFQVILGIFLHSLPGGAAVSGSHGFILQGLCLRWKNAWEVRASPNTSTFYPNTRVTIWLSVDFCMKMVLVIFENFVVFSYGLQCFCSGEWWRFYSSPSSRSVLMYPPDTTCWGGDGFGGGVRISCAGHLAEFQQETHRGKFWILFVSPFPPVFSVFVRFQLTLDFLGWFSNFICFLFLSTFSFYCLGDFLHLASQLPTEFYMMAAIHLIFKSFI